MGLGRAVKDLSYTGIVFKEGLISKWSIDFWTPAAAR